MSSQPTTSPSVRADRPAVAVAWLMTDMAVVNLMTVIVKMQGSVYPVFQLVFLRALVGLVAIVPLIVQHRREIIGTRRAGRHVFRITCNALALVGNFAAFAALPLAFVTALGFVRPLVAMLFATWLLAERVGRNRWLGAALGLVGVAVIVRPGEMAWNAGLLGVALSVVFGSLATVQARMLRDENTTVMMVFYTAGLTILTAVPAVWTWHPVATGDLVPLVAIGLMAQAGQFCFLRAYQGAPASFLAPFGYLSLVFATVAGFLFFGEVPSWSLVAGAAIVLASLRLASS